MADSPPCLILASSSPRRRELLALTGLSFQVQAARVDETVMEGEPPSQVALRLARAKALAVAALHPSALVIGCDTLVALDGEVLGKPADEAEARQMLLRLRNRSHIVYSGIAVARNREAAAELATTIVHMRGYGEEELEPYIRSGDPLDKAGAYGIQHPSFHPVASWEGCYTNVMGLPLCHLVRLLRSWSVAVEADLPAACQTHTGQRCSVSGRILEG